MHRFSLTTINLDDYVKENKNGQYIFFLYLKARCDLLKTVENYLFWATLYLFLV